MKNEERVDFRIQQDLFVERKGLNQDSLPMSRKLSYTWISRILALLLLTAAALRLNGLAVDPVGRMGLFTTPAFQIAVVEFEFFLAV